MSAGGPRLVLVAEHDAAVAELQRRYLAREGLRVRIEPDPGRPRRPPPDPGRAPAAAARARPDAVVLDLSSAARPADLYRRTADAAGPAPVVVTGGPPGGLRTAAPRPRRVDRPFAPRVLVAAVTDALRGAAARPGGPPGPLRAGPLALDPRRRTAAVGERRVVLTGTESDLLEFLMTNPGRVFTREQLLDAAWGPGAGAGSRTVDVHIAQLRAKLGVGAHHDGPIRTVRGVGYVLDA
ncbi:winged helix-turn-helix domain-containing protein [Actinomadura rifamycini]|uniref:winged helix-turn-helix domain-containing protein n=1 Tax=Actinomadura rifamycini TaxID=31962 RepID=UPI00041CC7B3|nr:response regulator transcription factor [Actinomadura rifamycini]